MKRLLVFALLICTTFVFSSCGENSIRGSVADVSANGDAILDIMPQKLLEEIEIGDTVTVTIGEFNEEMIFVDKVVEEDGKNQLFFNEEDWSINLCIYNASFCDTYNIDISSKVRISK